MPRIHVIVVALLVQTVFTVGISGNVIRRRRQQQQQPQQQPSASFYGNQNLAGSVPGGYNYGANTNLYGTNLNNQGSKDLYGNPIVQGNTANAVNAMGLVNQQQQQQQQHQQLQHQQQQLQQQQLQQQQQPQQQQPPLYGVNNPAAVNPSYPGASFYSGSGSNPLLRDANANLNMRDASGNPLPAGSAGSSPYSPSNAQIGYASNTNQAVSNKDMYNPAPNPTNNNNNNNNQYGYNVNPYPNSNTYSGQSATNNNNNAWSNNQYNSNAGDTWMPNRDLSSNSNANNNAYSNPNSPYFYNNDAGTRLTSWLMLMSLLFALALLRI